jgi:hypothetical protein
MHASTRVVALAVLLAATSLSPSAAVAGRLPRIERHQPLVVLMDCVWREHEQEGSADAIIQLGEGALRVSPRSYAVHWRMARAYWWLAHGKGDSAVRRDWARAGVDWARRAVELDSAAVEGHYFEALNIGEYATLIGIPTALLEGVAGRIEAAARRAYAIDPTFDEGGPMIVLGRLYFMLPWPKRDLRQSMLLLEEARRRAPRSLIARVYLAETYRALGDEEAARRELRYVARVGGQPMRQLANQKLREWFS